MAFTTDDIETLRRAKTEGLTKEQALARLSESRTSTTPTDTTPKSTFDKVTGAANKVTNFLGLKGATDTFGSVIARSNKGAEFLGQDAELNRANIEAPTKGQIAGAVLQTGVAAGSMAIPALRLKSAIAAGAGAGYAYDIGQDLIDKKSLAETAMPGFGAAIGAVAPGGGSVVKGSVKAVGTVAKAVTNSPVVKGALQSGIELAERVPRFISKKNVTLRDAATKAERIATSPVPIQNALKANVPEPIINTIEQADDATREGYRQIVQLAEETISTTGTLKTTARPEIVAGEAVAQQYKLVDAQQKKVGQAIGDAVKNLSNDVDVYSMRPAYSELQDALADAKVTVTMKEGDTGGALGFGKTGFTKAQRTKIQELYELATEGGEVLSASEIHAKDRLFSQLQREARMEGIGDIMVSTSQGQMSLFRIFRDVYSKNLEQISPEIRSLNSQYRNLSTFTEEIENTLIKSGKFETNSRIDPSEYAQTNLRRLFSEAQSAADYRAIADELDNASRALGYEGAVPSDLARFAYEIRKIYPETTPRTGLEGSIRASVGGMVDAVLSAGKADLSDQQKALRELLESIESLPQ